MCHRLTLWSASFNREIEYLKKETQRCAQVGAEASLLKEESGQLQEQVQKAGGGRWTVWCVSRYVDVLKQTLDWLARDEDEDGVD